MIANGQTILVVEDDEETLNIIARTLAAGGYDVIWARNGADTLKLLTRYEGRIAAIVADVVLPGMSGPQVVGEVCRTCPDTRAVYVSAYDEEVVRSHGVDPEDVPFLAKPYEPRDLLRAVEEALTTP